MGAALLVAGSAWAVHRAGEPGRRRARAEAASKAGDWPTALAAWRVVNAGREASGLTWLAQARVALASGRLADTQAALNRATALDPTSVEAWRLWIELLRVQDRTTDAQRVGWLAYEMVAPVGRRAVLRDLTFALLTEIPDDVARASLTRWSEAEVRTRSAPPTSDLPPDFDARVALLQRMSTMPRAGDPDRASRIAELAAVIEHDPTHLPAREALATTLLDGGDADRARAVLDAWPGPSRDARYWRLQGRLNLEYAVRSGSSVDPDVAQQTEDAFRKTLAELPHDWKTRVRLARTLRILGRDDEAKHEAEAVARLRERLEPTVLGNRLNRADPSDLAGLAASVGLARLATAWRRVESQAEPGDPATSFSLPLPR